jgi:hypothetical protein
MSLTICGNGCGIGCGNGCGIGSGCGCGTGVFVSKSSEYVFD